ncbi:hypothetical protein ACFQAV_12775 [Companilactobacillus huachuanensis]|uniref:Uncharacterized protein n=1 Tax=Companilactobacillus huachuanensis TaxID=2559914 RepID=A0ABW1RQJ5_9LACO|nr:hypothetical protein [Companilactobacillus huachuanensis]
MEDFTSGNGLTFYGDENYLVTTLDLAIELEEKGMLLYYIDSVLCPDKTWTKLITKYRRHGTCRQRVSSETLWAIVQAHE